MSFDNIFVNNSEKGDIHVSVAVGSIMSSDIVSLGMSRQRTLKDQLSPYKIAVLILIEDYCGTGPQGNVAAVNSYSDAEELTFLTTLLQLIQVVTVITRGQPDWLYRILCCFVL